MTQDKKSKEMKEGSFEGSVEGSFGVGLEGKKELSLGGSQEGRKFWGEVWKEGRKFGRKFGRKKVILNKTLTVVDEVFTESTLLKSSILICISYGNYGRIS